MITARVTLDADGSNRKQPAGFAALDRRFAFRAQSANGETGPRERMPVQEFRGDSQLFADLADFVLIERRERLDDSAGLDQLLNTCDAVVMSLDDIRSRGTAGFDGVGINRALSENPMAVEEVAIAQNALLHGYELLADDVAFHLRVAHAG